MAPNSQSSTLTSSPASHRAPTPDFNPIESAGCGCSAATPRRPTKPAHGSSGHDHAHDHADHADHADHDSHAGHDHSGLPGWRRLLLALGIAASAEALSYFAPHTPLWQVAGMTLAAFGIALAGLGVYRTGIASLLRGKLGINALMTVAVTGAFLIGQWPEAAMVMALYALAELIEQRATDRARHAISGLLALAPEVCEVRQADGSWTSVASHTVLLDAVMRIRPGARVPLDGVVLEGQSAIDQAPVTGESIPVDKAVGDPVFAGTINTIGELQVRITAAAGHTTLDRIIHAVEQAQATRAPTQRLVDRFAAVYTPAVFALALALALLAPPLLGWTWLAALYKALVLLVIACPCAFVIATPVTVVSGLTAAARRGILIKGGSYLEQARKLKAVALDKTGTLTLGRPSLVDWQPWREAKHEEVKRIAASLAARSDHPVSRAIAQGLTPADAALGGAIDSPAIIDFKALVGRGTEAQIDGASWVLGNHRLIEERGQSHAELKTALAMHEQQGRTVTLLADARGVQALFAVADTLKPGARDAVARLLQLGVTPVMLTGDNAATAQAVAAHAGIADARGNLLPEDKLAAVREMRQRYGPTGMTGDGINDAPALAQADIGFAMGAAGTDIAMEAADVVIMNDDLNRIAETIELSRRTHTVLWQNIGLALGIKLVFLGLAVAGSASMWMAVFADMGASLLVVANGLRLLRRQE